jgi:hypothetical protein
MHNWQVNVVTSSAGRDSTAVSIVVLQDRERLATDAAVEQFVQHAATKGFTLN